MKDILKSLIKLQEIDSRILEKRIFIDKVPMRIFEVDEPLKQAKSELEKIKRKNEGMANSRRGKEAMLDEVNEKIEKMKSRVSGLKTNKEYQVHLKEIETHVKKIADIEEEILLIMEDLDNSLKHQKEREEKVNIETEKINAFKKELDQEVKKHEDELTLLTEERARLVGLIDPDGYNTYKMLLNSGNGVAVTSASNEICLGCNMNIPPQLFVEIRKNEEINQCPQCHRILYYPPS